MHDIAALVDLPMTCPELKKHGLRIDHVIAEMRQTHKNDIAQQLFRTWHGARLLCYYDRYYIMRGFACD